MVGSGHGLKRQKSFFLFFFHPLFFSHTPSMLGASLVSSLLLGFGIYAALPATLFCVEVFVAECCPRLLELFAVELRSRVVWHHIFIIGPICLSYIPFLTEDCLLTKVFFFLSKVEVARFCQCFKDSKTCLIAKYIVKPKRKLKDHANSGACWDSNHSLLRKKYYEVRINPLS